MLSAPLAHDLRSSPRVADAATAGASQPLDDRDYAARRLSGTVWSNAPAAATYRGVIRVGKALGAIGISPNMLTMGSLVLAAGAGLAAAVGSFTAAALIMLLSGLCDALDGIVARATGRASRYGALLDSTVDRLSDGLPLVGATVFYAAEGRAAVAVPMLAMIGAFTVSYIRARTEALGGTLPPLFMRRAERLALLVVTFLLAPFEIDSIALPAPFVLVGIALLGVFSFVGAVSALRSARNALVGPRPVSVTEPSE